MTSPGAAESVVSSAAPCPATRSVELQSAGAELRQVVIEPFGQRGVEVADLAIGIDREEAGRRMVEIIDGVLQLLKDVFLALELARHVGDGPDRQPAACLPSPSGRTRMRSQRPGSPLRPPTRTSSCRRRPSRAALQQPIDRFRHAGVADEHPLDRAHVVGAGRPRSAPDRRHWHRPPVRRRRSPGCRHGRCRRRI